MISISAHAHGHVNLIGEHTDYNGGWVLPTPIPQQTTVSIYHRADNQVHASTNAVHLKGSSGINFKLGEEKPKHTWIDYIQGATKLLREMDQPIRGFDIHVESTVPPGSGLSSSAALEISTLKALRTAFHLSLTDVQIAKLAQRIENEFVGARVGIMDQMACSLTEAGEALYLDTQKMLYERIILPTHKMDLVVINSGISKQNSIGEYNQRRAECELACRRLSISYLRELQVSDLPKLDTLPEKLKKRARHVVTENERVNQAVAALRSENIKELGRIFYESHESMKNDYEISIPEIDLLVQLFKSQPSTFGARLTGRGFGGSVVAMTEKGTGAQVARSVAEEYEARSGWHPTILVPCHSGLSH